MLDKRILEQLFRRNYSEMIHLALSERDTANATA